MHMIMCPECKGQRRRYYIVRSEPLPITNKPDVILSSDVTIGRRLEDCRSCRGVGRIKQTGRVPVIQDGQRIGSVPAMFDPLAVKSASLLYNPRAGDFRREDDHWIVDSTLGPGDLEAIPGFVWDCQ